MAGNGDAVVEVPEAGKFSDPVKLEVPGLIAFCSAVGSKREIKPDAQLCAMKPLLHDACAIIGWSQRWKRTWMALLVSNTEAGYIRQATENLPKRIAAILARPNRAIGHPNEKTVRLLKVASHSSGGCFEVAR